jgi:hypothetical protein
MTNKQTFFVLSGLFPSGNLEKYGISAVAAIFLYNKPGQIWWS